MKRALGISLSAALIATMLFVFSSPALSSCPRGTVGKMKTESALSAQRFAWKEQTPTTFGTGEQLEIAFALIPFPETVSGSTYMEVGAEGGGILLSTNFSQGGGTDFGISYEPNKWNNIKVIADFDSQTYTVKMNGVTSDTFAFSSVSDGITYVEFGGYDNVNGDPAVGYIDTVSAIKRLETGGSVALFPAQTFKDAPPPETSVGVFRVVSNPIPEAATGAACPTTIGLTFDKTQTSIKAFGKVKPAHPGDEVLVTLFKKKAGSFVKIAERTKDLTAESRYSATFARPNKGRCKVVSKFSADEDHLGSHASKTSDC